MQDLLFILITQVNPLKQLNHSLVRFGHMVLFLFNQTPVDILKPLVFFDLTKPSLRAKPSLRILIE